MTYLENWQNISRSMTEILNESPYCVIYDRKDHRGVLIDEILEDFKTSNLSWKKRIESLSDLWSLIGERDSVLLRTPTNHLEYSTFLSEPLVLNKFIIVGVNILEVDSEELETTLHQIQVYLK